MSHTKNCFTRLSCRNCEEQHHTFLCPKTAKFKASNSNAIPLERSTPSFTPITPAAPQIAKTKNAQLSQSAAPFTMGSGPHITLSTISSEESITSLSNQLLVSPFTALGYPTLVTSHCLFDTGANKNFITDQLATLLSLPSISEVMVDNISFGGTSPRKIRCKKYNVVLKLASGNTMSVECLSMPEITGKIPKSSLHPSSLAFEDESSSIQIHLLLGNCTVWSLISGPSFSDSKGDRFIPTLLGNLAIPQMPIENRVHSLSSISSNAQKDEDPSQSFRQLIRYDTKAQKYFVSLPWKTCTPHLGDDHFWLAFGRLKSLHQTLRVEGFLDDFDESISELLRKQYVELCTKFRPKDITTPLRYLPLQAVHRPNKKLRVVYDGAARTKASKAINEFLDTGYNDLPTIPTVLTRIRCLKHFLIADVSAAFNQVGIEEEDRDALRILWLKDKEKDVSQSNLSILRFKVLPFGLTCAPGILSAVLHKHLENFGELGKEVEQTLYVDNFAISCSAESFEDKFNAISDIFRAANMKLHDFNSNSDAIRAQLNSRGHETPIITKILGVHADLRADLFFVVFPEIEEGMVPTKRTVLQKLSSVFNPLGMAEPVLLLARLLIQEIWKHKIHWDESLPHPLASKWYHICADWNSISLPFSRYFDLSGAQSIEAHVFVDASSVGRGTVAYLRVAHLDRVAVHFFSAKSRLIPTKSVISIPKLEFAELVLGAETLMTIRKSMTIQPDGLYLWSDSKVAIAWAKRDSTKGMELYVSNRWKRLRNCQDIIIQHVPGFMNIADVGSRGCTLAELSKNEDWQRGPSWLKDKEKWPVQDPPNALVDTVITNVTISDMPPNPPPFILNPDRFSNWNTFFRSATLVFLFLCQSSKTFAQKLAKFDPSAPFSPASSRVVFLHLLFMAQQACPPTEEEIKNYGLILENGLLVRKTRRLIEGTDSTFNPPYLPKKSPFVKLYIAYLHQSHHHSSYEYTLHVLKSQLFMPKPRTLIKTTVRECAHCKRFTAQPYAQPPFANFPPKRTSRSAPFTHTAVDFFGPLITSDGNHTSKRMVALYTCFSTRALWLDLVEDNTAEKFLNSLRRFTSTRGCPISFYSDSANNFLITSQIINKDPVSAVLTPDPSIGRFLQEQKIKWDFIPSKGSFMGGIYERLVALCKSTLHKSLGRRLIPDDELRTQLLECASIINSRPLCYQAEGDTPVLTPNDFLGVMPKQLPYPTDNDDDPDWLPENDDSARAALLKRWKDSNSRLEKTWNYWNKAYVTTLQDRVKNTHDNPHLSVKSFPQLNEIVILQEDKTPRQSWRLGRVSEISSNRHVKIALGERNGQRKTVARPINRICPLELRAFSTCLISLLCLVRLTLSCSDLAVLTGQAQDCQISDVIKCRYQQSTLFPVTPSTQTVCAELRAPNNEASTRLVIKLKSVKYKCHRSTLAYTRQVAAHVVKSVRCDQALGSECFSNFCESTKSETKIPAFGDQPNSAPGHTNCFRRCGCAWCGCGLCSEGCLFYRYFLESDVPDIFTVFSCPSFTPTVVGEFTLNNITKKFVLTPALPYHFSNITLTVASLSTAPAPIFNSMFLQNLRSNSTAIIPETVRSSPSNPLSVYPCASASAARDMSCPVRKDICRCSPDSYDPHCSCHVLDLPEILRSDHALPLRRGDLMLSEHDGEVLVTASTPLQLQIQINETLVLQTHLSTCTIEDTNIIGCLDCTEGATMSMKCSTNFGPTTARFECDSTIIKEIECITGERISTSIYSTTSDINEDCKAICVGGETQFSLKGKLAIAQPIIPSDMERAAKDLTPEVVSVWEALKDIWGSYKTIFITVLSVGLFLIAVYLLQLFIPLFMLAGECLRNRQPRPQLTPLPFRRVHGGQRP
uniref:Integrase catalytic domain-containing protein n=2 Tax=Bursaphelenchus xylophilus TaxID=6326 RepID=A0A1I7SG60_BURXY